MRLPKVLRLFAFLGLFASGLFTEARALALTLPYIPENTSAFANCTAKVKVDAARLRAAPSLDAPILGLRLLDETVYVLKVEGKWVEAVLPDGTTGYMAAYLLAFPYHDLLEQWKRETPSPSVGKKAKVKWASVNLRKYPSAEAPRMGAFSAGDVVAVLLDQGNGWSLVESLSEDGKPGCYGFVRNRSLEAPEARGAPDRALALSPVRRPVGEALVPSRESPAQYLARTAWSPDVFALERTAAPAFAGRGLEMIAMN
jgi:hypothetical protein